MGGTDGKLQTGRMDTVRLLQNLEEIKHRKLAHLTHNEES